MTLNQGAAALSSNAPPISHGNDLEPTPLRGLILTSCENSSEAGLTPFQRDTRIISLFMNDLNMENFWHYWISRGESV